MCERHAGKKIPRVLREELNADVNLVPINPDPGDDEIVISANSDNRTIVTRDDGFTSRPICSISGGVLFIPQSINNRTVKLDDVLDCLKSLGESGRLDTLGHGVCTLMPQGINIRTADGDTYIEVGSF